MDNVLGRAGCWWTGREDYHGLMDQDSCLLDIITGIRMPDTQDVGVR